MKGLRKGCIFEAESRMLWLSSILVPNSASGFHIGVDSLSLSLSPTYLFLIGVQSRRKGLFGTYISWVIQFTEISVEVKPEKVFIQAKKIGV